MKTIFTFLILCFLTFISYAQPGTLDRSFGDTGIAMIPVSSGDLNCLGLQSDGKIIVAGTVVNEIYGFAIMRCLPNGQPDQSFGDNGAVYINNKSAIYTIEILPDDKILAVGTQGDDSQLQLAKYLPDGKLDSSFGINGQVHEVFESLQGVMPKAAKLQADGKIVIAGAGNNFDIENGFVPHLMVARFNEDGSLDESFGGVGYVLLEGKIANDMFIQPDGKIVIGGDNGYGINTFITARYLPDGSLDESFGTDGVVRTSFNDSREYINALILQPDGKILAAGKADLGIYGFPLGNMGIVRYMPNGSLDISFGANGMATIQFDGSSEAINMFLDNNEKIILTGKAGNFYDTTFYALAKLNPNGSIDSSFGINGLTTTAITGNDFVTCGALQSNGKILVGGTNAPGTTDFILARYNNNDGMPIAKKIQKILKWWRNRNNSVTLNWQNAVISSTGGYYRVQRAAGYNTNQNTGTWVNIGRVVSSNAVTNNQTQSFTDNNPLPGTNYYRVQQVSATGNIETTNIVAVTINQASAVSVSPNPVQDMLYIKGLDASTNYSLQVSNRQGNIVAKATVKQASLYKLNVEQLPKGVYYLKILSGVNTTDLKFVKE